MSSSLMYGLSNSSPTWEYRLSNDYYFESAPPKKPDLCKIQNESPTRNIAIYTCHNTRTLSELLNAAGALKSFYPCASHNVMIASFYDLRHATIAFNTLNAFLALSDGFVCYAKPEILQGLTNKTVLVEMKGPFNILSKFNFMNFLSTYGSIHYMTNFRLSDTHHIALLEYHDERVHTELDRKLDGTSIQGVLFSVHQTVDDYTCTSCFARDASKTASFEHKVKTFWSYSPPPSFLDFKAPSDHLQQDDNSQSYFSTNPFPKEFNTPVRIPTSPTKTPTPPPPVHSSSKRSSMESQCSLLSTPSSSTSSVTNVPSTPQKIMSNETKTWNKKKSDMNGFDLDRIQRGQDKRTTLMIRNIPNKYTQQMLIDNINSTHKAAYDFLYLRIDFKNKCNVGYAFINFIDVKSVVSFAKDRVGRKWGKFNSEKVCSLSYANIQGKDTLIKKFRNSNVMQEEEAYRPKIFYSNGPLKGQEEVFPDKEAEYENHRPEKNGHHRHHR